MSALDKINLFIRFYIDTINSLRKPRIILPFIVYAAILFVLLLALVNYVHPLLYPLLSGLIAPMGNNYEDLFGHYPGLYILLPRVFQWLKLIPGVLFEGLAVGMSALMFQNYFGSKNAVEKPLSTAFRLWPQLLATWTVITGLLLIINIEIPALFASLLAGSPRQMVVFDAAMRLGTVAIYSVFIYAVPAVAVRRINFLKALGDSVMLFLRQPVFSFFLAFVPFLATLPVSYAAGYSRTIVSKFNPEIIFYILAAGIIIDIFVNYFITGTVVQSLGAQEKPLP